MSLPESLNQKTARIAFIGAGNHATQSLYPNIPMIPEFDLVAVCDLDENKARATAHRYGAQPFTDVETMLERIQPDGSCVCGPAEMHFAVSQQVLRRGIRLFVEKPPAPNLAQAEELVEMAEKYQTWGMVAFMKRFAPANVLAKEFMESASFGSLSSMTLMHGSGPYQDLRRMMYFNGIHMIDLGRFLGGEVEKVFAYSSYGGKYNFGLSATWKLKNGGVAQLNQNSGQTWHDCFEAVYISGALAGIFIDASRQVQVMYDGAQFAPGKSIELFGFSASHSVSGNMAGWTAGGHYQRGYWGELSRFARACLELESPSPTLVDGAVNIRLIEAMLESAKLGLEVKVSSV
jgi:myo-inositol 2-dehydrogenase/D-chiro-inositol 1-dehydrogenase